MLKTNILLSLVLLTSQLIFSCDQEKSDEITNQVQNDSENQKKILEIKEQIKKVLENKNISKKSTTPIEEEV